MIVLMTARGHQQNTPVLRSRSLLRSETAEQKANSETQSSRAITQGKKGLTTQSYGPPFHLSDGVNHPDYTFPLTDRMMRWENIPVERKTGTTTTHK